MRDIADNGLAAVSDGNMLQRDILFGAGPAALKSLHLTHKCASELVEGAFRAVLLRDNVRFAASYPSLLANH